MCRMSALGQKQTCAVQNVMSALPPIADMTFLIDGHSEEKLARKFVENINGRPRRLADLDEVAIRITHVAPQFVAVVIERLGNKLSAFFGPNLYSRHECLRRAD